MAFGCTVVSTVTRLRSWPRNAGLVRHPQALGQQRLQLVAEPLAPMAQVRALVREGVLKELFAGEELEIRVVNPALANALIGQSVSVLEQQQADHEPGLDSGPAILAVERRDLAVDPVPVDLAGELNQLVLHVDDLVQPRPEQIVRSRRPVLLRSHGPLRCTTESRSAAKGNPQTEIARFGGLKPPIPAISNATATEKLTPAQSLRALFTDDYRVVENFAKLPDGWQLTDVASVAVDSKDRVYVFNRGAHPMVVLDREGNFLRSWGEGLFSRPHGLHIDADDNLYCTDDGDHTVRKCTTDGKVLLTIGIPEKPSPFMSGDPFHRCTHTALSPKGEIYVSDGYGNARVHKFTPDGKLMKSWGEPGTDPGEFNIVHNIATDADGFVYVADRENHRVQVFDGNGRYETQWNNLHRPCALCCCGGKQPNFVIGELGPGMAVNRKVPNLGPRLSIVDAQGKRIARLGGENGPGLEAGKFLAPHGIALDSKGDIYLGEVGVTDWKTSFPDTPMPAIVRCLQKLEKI